MDDHEGYRSSHKNVAGVPDRVLVLVLVRELELLWGNGERAFRLQQ